MATVNFINRKKSQTRAGTKFVLTYTMRESKTMFEGRKLVSGLGCTPESVYEEFINTKLLYGKDSQRMHYHFVQSFHKDEKISPTTAHEIAVKTAEFYKDFEVLISTHVDKDHIHSHFIINSVSYETGKKLHQSAHAIQELRMVSDNLCMEYGLSICQPNPNRTKAMSAGEYHSAKRGDSWKFRLMNTIDECMRYAKSKRKFIEMMESEGYQVNWSDSRKNITYTTPEGNKSRDNKLHEMKYLKEMMEREFRIRRELIDGRIEKTEQATIETTTIAELQQGNTGADAVCDREFGEPEPTAKTDIDNQSMDAKGTQTETQLFSVARAEQETGEDLRPVDTDEQDPITGWEEERLELFNPKTQTTEDRNISTYNDFDNGNMADIGSDLVQIGASIERLGNAEPVIDSTTQPTIKVSRKHRIGEKEDDHRHGFEMKM